MPNDPLRLQPQMTPDAPLIETSGLEKSFGAVKALSGIALSLPPGAIGLVGLNGAGKTTLLKILLGLLKPDSGSARVQGLDPSREGPKIREGIGFVPQDDCYWGGLSAVGSVQFAGRLCGMPPKDALVRAHETLDRIGMGEERYRLSDGYSLGMRQKVRMAQAVVHDPKILILDEPTRGLDPGAKTSLLKWLHGLKAEGMSLLISTHELEDIEQVCDQILVLDSGKVVLSAPIERLRSQSIEWEMQCISSPEDILPAFGGLGLKARPEGGKIRFDSDLKTSESILNHMKLKGLKIRSLRKSKVSLEDVLRSLKPESV